MRNFTWNRFPIKNLLIDSLLTPIVESTYLNRDMCKFESSQKDESRWQSIDSSKAYRNTGAFKCCYEVVGHEFAASQPVLPTANEWQTDHQAAPQRHQQRVASYQYVRTRFSAHQKVHVNKRLLTCCHVMMSNEHKKHSLDAPWTSLWKIVRRGPITYTVDWKGKAYTVGIDRLQPTYVIRLSPVLPWCLSFCKHQQQHQASCCSNDPCFPSFSLPSDAIRHQRLLT